MSYIGTEPKDIRSFGRTKFDYTATQGQTAFTGADDDGKVLAFTTGQIEVYVNGILMDDSDFTTTGTGTVTLASAANLNDVVNVVSFETNIPDSNYVPASGGTFTGAVTHTGAFTSKGIDDNADATAITIDASERVGIGAIPKTQHANVTDALNVGSSNIFQRTKDGYITSNFYYNSSDIGKSIASGHGVVYQQDVTNGRHTFWATATAAGSADATATINPELTIDADGLKFNGDTAAANALNDYEEGTWTPSFPNGGTVGTVNAANYTKIGRIVWAGCYIATLSGIPNNTNLFTVGGLPFTVSGSSSYHAAGGVSYVNAANWRGTGALNTPVTTINATNYYFHREDGTAGAMQNSAASILNSQEFICTVVYQTDA